MANDISTDLTEYMLRQSWGESAMREALINKGERPDITQERLRLFRDNKDSGNLSKPLPGDTFAPWWHYVSLVLYGGGFVLKHLPPNSDDIQLKLIDFIDSHPTCTQEEFKSAILRTDKSKTILPASVSDFTYTSKNMDVTEFKTEFLETVKADAASTGEGSCASFVYAVAQNLIEAEVLSDFNPSFYLGRLGRNSYRVDGYVYDEFDNTMSLVIADYSGNDLERTLTNTGAQHDFEKLRVFMKAALTSDLYKEIEMSTPCADLVDLLRSNEENIRKYRLLIFTDAEMSAAIKNVEIEEYSGIPVEGQIWDLNRLYRVCCSEQGRQPIEIDFKQYCEEGIPCLEASSAATDQYKSYLGVIPGEVLADIYDKYGSRLLEGNVRSFLSTKVAVNKKIRSTILTSPQMFFAFNNGISATAMDVEIETTDRGLFITSARDFQIINGGQTTASISNARYKDKADLTGLYVQMKLTAIDASDPEKSDELIKNISRSSNSQNKVSDADFFASHPFHRRMEQISRHLFAPAVNGAQYETKWFYERARGQYLQEQMRLTPAEKKRFQLQHPKSQVIKKTDLAKVRNTWLSHPDIVSKGAQTNFADFAKYIDVQWNADEKQFNERYFQTTVALILIFQYLEKIIPKQPWYEGGYRANIIYYTVALFRLLIQKQFPGQNLDLMLIWNSQRVSEQVGSVLITLAELVLQKITHPDRGVANVTQWCKREACWSEVKEISLKLPRDLADYLISVDDQKAAQKAAKKEQKLDNGIYDQTKVVKYPVEMWKKLAEFSVYRQLVTSTDVEALKMACNMPARIPNTYQSKRLLMLLQKAQSEGFSMDN